MRATKNRAKIKSLLGQLSHGVLRLFDCESQDVDVAHIEKAFLARLDVGRSPLVLDTD